MAVAVIRGVALDDCSADVVNDILHELRAQEILVSRLAAVELYRDVAFKLDAQRIKRPYRILGANIFNKIHFFLFHTYHLAVIVKILYSIIFVSSRIVSSNFNYYVIKYP